MDHISFLVHFIVVRMNLFKTITFATKAYNYWKNKEKSMMNMTLGYTQTLISEGRKAGLLRNQMAYLLATTYWETARTMKPISELGGERYLKSKKYYPWYGRGFVQLTWEYNYKKAGQKLNVDLIGNKDLALDPEIAAKIAIQGMINGWFTGKKLSDYITLSKSDFLNARRIINGTDKAKEIAAIAVKYDNELKVLGYGKGEIPSMVSSSPVERLPDDPGISTPETEETSVRSSVSFLEGIMNIFKSFMKGL